MLALHTLSFIPQGPELWIILIVVLVLFGGRKIPELLRGVGKGVGELQKGLEEGRQNLEKSIKEDPETKKPSSEG